MVPGCPAVPVSFFPDLGYDIGSIMAGLSDLGHSFR